jgi:hypothetical protein
MPIASYPVQLDGLVVNVVIGLNATDLRSRMHGGQTFPAPVQAKGIVDTGSDVTCVSTLIFNQLGITPTKHVQRQTTAGRFSAQLFEVSLSLLTIGGANVLAYPDLTVMETRPLANSIDVLIGLDILLNCKLLLDGPARQFHLEF